MNQRKKRELKSDHYSFRNRENEFAGGRALTRAPYQPAREFMLFAISKAVVVRF